MGGKEDIVEQVIDDVHDDKGNEISDGKVDNIKQETDTKKIVKTRKIKIIRKNQDGKEEIVEQVIDDVHDDKGNEISDDNIKQETDTKKIMKTRKIKIIRKNQDGKEEIVEQAIDDLHDDKGKEISDDGNKQE